MRKLNNRLVLITLLIFIVSLFFDAFTIRDMGETINYPSFEVFLVGPISFLGGAGREFLTWTANVWFLVSIVCVVRKCYLISIISGLIAFLIAGSFIFCEEVLAAENGRTAEIINLNAGYFIWLTSILSIIFSSVYLKITKKKNA